MEENPGKVAAAYKEQQELFLQGKVNLFNQQFDGKTQLHEAIRHSLTPGKANKTVLCI